MAIDYLRLSLTDRCNLNCIYCTPLEKSGFLAHDELLRHEEIARAAAAFVAVGVKKIRLTGGEPLLRKNIVGLVKMLKAIPGLKELAMTTNGVLLRGLAGQLREVLRYPGLFGALLLQKEDYVLEHLALVIQVPELLGLDGGQGFLEPDHADDPGKGDL